VSDQTTLRRAVAIALVVGDYEGGIGDAVGQETWDALFAEGVLTTLRDQTGEARHGLTGEAIEELRRALAVSPADTTEGTG